MSELEIFKINSFIPITIGTTLIPVTNHEIKMKKSIIYLLPIALLFFQCGGTKEVSDAMKNEVKEVKEMTDFRAQAPAAAPAPKIQISDPETFTLDNGLQVVVVENHKIPRVSFQLLLDNDPMLEGDIAGAASMAGRMLTKGTTSRTKAQIDEEIDFIGARLSTNESALASDKDSPDAIARNVASVLRYGKDHPYGELTTEATVEKITLQKCKDYYNTYFKPNVAYMAVVGDITPAEAKEMLNKYLGDWKRGEVPAHTFNTPTQPDGTEVAFVNKDGSVQSVISVTYPVDLKPGASDAIPASVMNSILGGGVFSGRLMQNLREDKAYTYGARSSLSRDKLVGRFSAGASVRNEVTDSSVVQFIHELHRMRDTDVDEKDLNLVLNSMTGSFARSLERPQTLARFALNTIRYDLPKDYYATYLEKLNAVSIADVKAMAKKYIKPENAYILVVGNEDEVAGKLGKFAKSGQVDFYDNEGNPIEKAEMPMNVNPSTIINKFVEATGGKAAYDARKDYTVKRTMSISGMSLEMSEMHKAPNMFKVDVMMGPQVAQSIVFDGTKGKSIAMGGAKMMEGEELEKMKYEAAINPEAAYEKIGAKLELKGVESIDGNNAYKIKVTMPDGTTKTEFYDEQSGLKIREVSTQDGGPTGSIVATSSFEDYKEVEGGLLVPHTIKQSAGPQNFTLTLTEYKANTGISDDEFKVE